MNRTLFEILTSHEDPSRCRQSLLYSDVVKSTRLADLLADPEGILALVDMIPKVGDVNIRRLKRAIAQELAGLVPAEWAAAIRLEDGEAPEKDGLDRALVARLQRLRAVWGLSVESYSLTGQFHTAYMDPANAVLAAALQARTPFVYAPETLPEILKTAAVLRAELGPTRRVGDYIGRIEAARARPLRVPEGSLLLLNEPRLTDLVERRGVYAALAPADVTAQLTLLADTLARERGLTAVVTQFRTHGFASGFATRQGPLFHYCYGGYLEMRGLEMIRHFHDMARATARSGQPLAAWLDGVGVRVDRRAAPARAEPAGSPGHVRRPRVGLGDHGHP